LNLASRKRRQQHTRRDPILSAERHEGIGYAQFSDLSPLTR